MLIVAKSSPTIMWSLSGKSKVWKISDGEMLYRKLLTTPSFKYCVRSFLIPEVIVKNIQDLDNSREIQKLS